MVTPSLYDEDGRLALMPSVYSLAFPETNAVFDATIIPPRLWRVSARRHEFDETLASFGVGPLPAEGERKLGLMDLMHEPILTGILEAVSPTLPGITSDRLRYRYPLHGTSAGIGILMNYLRTVVDIDEVCLLAGDYEGYAAQAGHFGLRVKTVQLDEAAATTGQTWFVSTPSAVDGEPLPAGLIETLVASNRVVVDCAYHGLQGGGRLTPVPEGAWAALWSLSKPWGLFWRRVGVLASSEEIPGAYGTRWYKDPARLLAAHAVVTEFAPGEMADRYRWVQAAAVDALKGFGIEADASSTVLLARIHKKQVSDETWAGISRAERRPGSGIARVCLTPLMEQIVTNLA